MENVNNQPEYLRSYLLLPGHTNLKMIEINAKSVPKSDLNCYIGNRQNTGQLVSPLYRRLLYIQTCLQVLNRL